jgi:catechol 2,3-dioxygenase-like lactoylglutathione lyase family enzyme
MVEARKARAVGFNHVALEVGDIEEALAFYGRLFDFKLRGKSGTSAFIDLGDLWTTFVPHQPLYVPASHSEMPKRLNKCPLWVKSGLH